MLDFIAGIFKYPMMWFYNVTGSYVIAIILFTMLVKLLLLPFSIKQQKTQIKGAKLRPKIAIIEKKYKGRTDRDSLMQKQNEIMELQQKEGYSPFGGCLQLILQIPILLGLYQVVRKPLSYLLGASEGLIKKINLVVAGAEELPADELALIKSLGEKGLDISTIKNGEEFIEALPDMTVFGSPAFNLADTPAVANFNWLLLIPVLSFVLSFLSMKITRRLNAPVMAATTPEAEMSTKIMDWTMPLMSLFIAFSVPGAVGFYWACSYVFSIIQTVIIAKAMPLPTFTEEELRQYEKEMKGSHARTSRPAPGTRPTGPIRSLHHIDDDDYTPAQPAQKKPTQPARTGGIQAAPIKKDDDK